MNGKQKAINKSITTQYEKYYQKYKKIYGDKCVILMQVGSFFEIYGSDPDDLYVDTVCNLLNIICTRKNKSINEISAVNPKFAGFTMVAFDKYLRVLQDNQWTTVVIEQVTAPPNPKRDVTQIISPGTYIDANLQTQSNFVFSIYVERLKQYGTDTYLNYVGLSAVDVSTGKVFVFETSDTLTDRTLAAHEAYRFIHSYSSNPKEVIINFEQDEDPEFINTLALSKHYSGQWHNDFMNKPSFQEKIFQKYYKSEIMSSIEFLDLEQHPHARISLCVLFQYIYEHNQTLLMRMSKPIFWDLNDYLILSHDAYEQLNLYLPGEGLKSVYDVLNHTSTSMGARLLRDQLLHPMTSIEKLEERYDRVAYYQNKTDMLKTLKTIVDLERFHRKLLLGKLHPMEFVKLVQSYEVIIGLNDDEKICAILSDKLKEYERLFCFDKMAQCKLDQMCKNFFNKGIYPEIDSLEEEKQNNFTKLNTLRTDIIQKLVKDDKKTTWNDDLVKLVKTDKEGYHLTMTKLRWKKVEKHFDYECRAMSSYVKLSNKNLRSLNANLEEIDREMAEKLLVYFLEFSQSLEANSLYEIHNYVAKLDVNLSAAHVANIYGYNRPKLVERGESYILAKDMRHPLVERVHTTETYVPNDICLGKDENGIIITGLNALGKSTLLKAVGVNVVLAQAGFFVPCSYLELAPFRTVLTRIEGNDDLLKGKSSFMVEMMDLKSIIERSNVNSLVLADELTKGTEHLSGLSILATSVQDLSSREVPFIYTTHLHRLKDIPEVKELTNVGYYYIRAEVTDKGVTINRKLERGFCDSLYGIEVARFILDKPEFIKQAFKIRNFLLDEHDTIVNCKTSRYNKDVYMDRCQWDGCNETKQLHTHHILHQEDADKHGLNDGRVRKNQESNLMVLCEKHHRKIHNKL